MTKGCRLKEIERIEAHYLVEKRGGETSVKLLDANARVQELARMLSGAAITPAAIANARELLSQ